MVTALLVLAQRCSFCVIDYKPAFHPRPPCYNKQTPHDIAGALFEPSKRTWHVMAGCWEYPLHDWRRKPGGW